MPKTVMPGLALAAICAMAAPTIATAQSSPALIAGAPAPQPGDFCYYAGLAYSESAMLTIDVPFRRDSPAATQKELLTCVRSEDGQSLVWAGTNLERPGTVLRVGE